MSNDPISNWVEKAKSEELVTVKPDGVLVIKRVEPGKRAWAIIKIAETLFPWFMKAFEGQRDENGMLMHPARVRGITINVAQRMIKQQESE